MPVLGIDASPPRSLNPVFVRAPAGLKMSGAFRQSWSVGEAGPGGSGGAGVVRTVGCHPASRGDSGVVGSTVLPAGQ